MKCPICGTYNNDYHIYCYYCGTKLLDKVSTEDKHKSNYVQADSLDDLNLIHKSFEQMNPDTNIEKEIPIYAQHIEKEIPIDTQHMDYMLDDSDIEYDPDQLTFHDNHMESSLEEAPPLKRKAKKAKEMEDKSLKLLIKICTTIIIISILLFAGLIFYDKVIRSRFPSPLENTSDISASYSVIQDTIDGIPIHRIIIKSDTGEEVKILDKTAKIVDGETEIIIEDKELMTIAEELTSDEDMKVTLDVTVTATGAKTKLDKISFHLAPRAAPLTMIHPKTEEYIAEDDSLTLLMEVTPESKVLINNDNFSDMVTKEGKLEKTFELSEQLEQTFEIKVVTKGFKDNIHTITVKRANKDRAGIPLTIDQKQPIVSNEEWVKLTGNTSPEAKLNLDIELRQEPKIDKEGNFTIFAKTANIGYTPCTLTSSLESGETTSLELILERATTEAEYTSKAWEFTYNDMVRDQSLHNGTIFLLAGKISDIISLDGKYAFTIDISTDDSTEQLVYIEYWGNIKLEKNQALKIFGNRWGNEGDMPKVLAKFIYKI